jgi:hypothetical protein
VNQWKEIVILVEMTPEHLAVFPAVIGATLDVWSDSGACGDTATWAVYESVYQPPIPGL